MPKRTPHNHDQIRETVVKLCGKLLLSSSRSRNETELFVLKRLLNELVWKLSEAADTGRTGKYVRCENWSEKALEEYKRCKKEKSSKPNLVFEHVVPRRLIVQKLLDSNSSKEIENALNWVLSCVVTKDEDKKLSERDRAHARDDQDFRDPASWWWRYKNADISWRAVTDADFELALEFPGDVGATSGRNLIGP